MHSASFPVCSSLYLSFISAFVCSFTVKDSAGVQMNMYF